ncbi:MAG TPA: methionyl-tRNA formyltransferase [Candidatus Sulfotelmatobacter sp.]|jgi:methionyl-tRNA formyltransferase|nr:methionyl-tRNA formyltransferase [Candidatus Sulfotelmatobacter sp.]
MRIVFFGTPKEVIPVLKNLIKHFEVVAVITAPDQKSGRKQFITPPAIKIVAQQLTIPVLQPKQLSESVKNITKLKADLFVVAAYGKIIPEAILKLPKLGAINIHPSLLPKYRGPTPIQTILLKGDQVSGVTFIQMDKQLDHGPILHQILFTLEKTDTFEWLMQSKFAQAAVILPQVIIDYASKKLKPLPQDDSQATFTKMIKKEDGYVDLDNLPDPKQLDRMIRAYYPWPTVWTKALVHNREVRIKFLPEKKLQVEGKNPVNIKNFINGYPELKSIKKNFS